MSTDQPPPGSPDDPFAKPPPGGPYGGGPYGAPPPGGPGGQEGPRGPYDAPPPGGPGDPYGGGGGPYGGGPPGDPYGGEPDPLAGMPPLAESGKRVLARIIDLVIVFIPAALIDWGSGGTDDFGSSRSAIGSVAFAVIGFFYEWLMTQSTGQTVGKKAMKLRAAMLDNGSVPSSSASAVRALVLWLPAFCCTCVWFGIIGITVLFDKPYKQGLHEKAAKTVVVQAV
ncbi:RDD family protein [Streptomyces sp. NPDC051976]|uniref:RDD family protein n=1 Tax=Streptomyces sp. NPDC051976 TaxID=3154947 RepID=UPI00343339A1